mmetsp:Transcript_3242/g.3192  ORF Transcript_3242/g.3192 Transcript_3242/m.3192 type:complete len:93 (+) Transcript_3242:1157-1435(+)|eukprot:CAMPEP_0170546108 /NCGR_PEP_ID=MMETSP0211-20121228/4458_1 /TAXON_ID=311385 /ORGANISM="Pseudokeronopsis sp., Strain OXSARD2" /LENGTH=92 /DNA_ID=CAMNT_0010850379 /DNA_START=1114 /DNA_END=1392 /DNA_ORIENTATION=-
MTLKLDDIFFTPTDDEGEDEPPKELPPSKKKKEQVRYKSTTPDKEHPDPASDLYLDKLREAGLIRLYERLMGQQAVVQQKQAKRMISYREQL